MGEGQTGEAARQLVKVMQLVAIDSTTRDASDQLAELVLA